METADPRRPARLVAINGLAAILAHELSQPLTAAATFLASSAMALRQRIQGLNEVLGMVDDAGRQTARVQELIRRMRTFVISGRVSGRREDLRAMLDAAWERTQGTEGTVFEPRFRKGSVFVLADRLQIEQVLGNLLLNAVQAMGEMPDRRIDARAIAHAGKITLTIADSGPGIDPDIRDILFDPLVSTRSTGMGLGLPLCLTIMEAHGGALWAEPPPHAGGAAFTLVLPAAGPDD